MQDSSDILRKNRTRERRYAFDRVFSSQTPQVFLSIFSRSYSGNPIRSWKACLLTVCKKSAVFDMTCPSLLDGVLAGGNATVFAYGPTGAGKTFTMVGTPSDPGPLFDFGASCSFRFVP